MASHFKIHKTKKITSIPCKKNYFNSISIYSRIRIEQFWLHYREKYRYPKCSPWKLLQAKFRYPNYNKINILDVANFS